MEAVELFAPVGLGWAERVAVSVRVRLYVGLTDSVRLCVHVRYRVRVGVKVSWTVGLTVVHSVDE